jgi:predicted enzyme related to lactoylglutathione lyase
MIEALVATPMRMLPRIEHVSLLGARIGPKRQDEDCGRFAWVYDPEGNKIELWEPK